MPRFSDHCVKSAIRLVRQSTTVPNTSNTNAFTAEISDMLAPCFCYSCLQGASEHLAVLDEPEIVGNLVVERPRLDVVRLGQPIHPARARRLGLGVHRFDQGPPQPTATRSVGD